MAEVPHVVIVGCGRVGSTLARTLTSEGSTVALIDRRASAFERLGDLNGVERIVGVGFDRATLLGAGIERAGAVAAVTNGDNTNILVARVARENFRVERVVARIYDPRRAEIYQRLGIATVATVTWTTQQVLRRLRPAMSTIEWADPGGAVRLVEHRIERAEAGRPFSGLVLDHPFRLVAVTRNGRTALGSDALVAQEDDVAYLALDMTAGPA